MNDSIKLLNLKDDEVEIITSYIQNNTLYINLTLRKKEKECPNCKSISNKIESYRIKHINHPMLNNIKCIINYRCRRLKCRICGKHIGLYRKYILKMPKYVLTHFVL